MIDESVSVPEKSLVFSFMRCQEYLQSREDDSVFNHEKSRVSSVISGWQECLQP